MHNRQICGSIGRPPEKHVLSYRRFMKGSKGEVDDMLRAGKSENPMRIVYCFGISYIRSTNPHHEYGTYEK